MELDQFGFDDFSLMGEERLESALVLGSEDGQDSVENPAVMLLTDKRVIHINGNGKHRKAVFASVQDVEAVEVAVQKEGNGRASDADNCRRHFGSAKNPSDRKFSQRPAIADGDGFEPFDQFKMNA